MRFLTALFFLVSASVASAENGDMIVQTSLVEAEASLAAMPDKSADDQFALGAVRFLRGIERSLQFRWQHNMAIKDFDIPALRLPIPPNANPDPFSPELITVLFENLRDDMTSSRAALNAVEGDAVLELDLMALWFDINMNGVRDQGEAVIPFLTGATMSRRQAAQMSETMPANLPVRFDTADVAWLTAYTHMLSGFSELVIAFDPTAAIAKVLDANQHMMNLRGTASRSNMFDAQFGGWVDKFAMVYGALNQQPTADNTRAAHGHFLEMIAQNKAFWAEVALETDNANEWIPNAQQTAALGFTLPEGAAESWQSILEDAEKVLNGEVLVSFWRIAPAGGVNVQKLFENPPVVDIVDWVQGAGLLPYLERGPTLTSRNFRQFERMFSGDALLFALLFN